MINFNSKFLHYIAIGDAYCASCEYVEKNHFIIKEALRFQRYLKHPKHNNVPGAFTDDTQMSVGCAEVLLGDDWSELGFANGWVKAFKRDPINGYSRKFQKFLEDITSGEEFLEKIIRESNKNGGAMRSIPFGVLPTPEEVIKIAHRQAAITHNLSGGIFGSLAIALMAHYIWYDLGHINREEMGSFLRSHLKPLISSRQDFAHAFAKPWEGRVRGPEVGFVTAIAVFEIINAAASLKSALRQVIEWGGDTDSVAALVLGLGCSFMRENLPDFMHLAVAPNTKYGSEFLLDLGKKLEHKFG